MIQRARTSLRRGVSPSEMSEGTRVLVACSGGRDSVVLTDVLHVLARTQGFDVHLLHVDHQVRDDSSHAADVVQMLGERLERPFHLRRLERGIQRRHPGVGLEEALRRERYRAYRDVATAIDADIVAVGHHQRDQAETVLLHIMRGAGLAGASGMREWSTIVIPWWTDVTAVSSIRIWRPLLDEPIEAIERWHADHELPLAEDHTNSDSRYRRNAVRHQVLPLLESISPGATGNLARFGEMAAEDEALLNEETARVINRITGGALERKIMIEIAPAMQRRVIRRWLQDIGFSEELSLDRVDAIRAMMLKNRSGSAVEIGAQWRVILDRGMLKALPPGQEETGQVWNSGETM